ncbi:WW domain-binding protein 11 [Plasmodiophora brassicae]|uniref:Wbp11/ELF5/Saf1 N-terminal domain-containing protein n=1 Tax=Plasmodiophora brassicae TaxID=37360 RepID=A0A0G4J481_PLABS|nr:hypothetical protein PBRA_002404 [Plasmodiophora brassicae]
MNPVEKWRKKEKKKQAKKHAEDKVKARQSMIMSTRTPEQVLGEIKRIQWAERQGTADPKLLAHKRRLLEAHRDLTERRRIVEERAQHDSSVVVKGLSKLLGQSSSGSSSKPVPESKQAESLSGAAAPSPDDEPPPPPNLAPAHLAPPWAVHAAPYQQQHLASSHEPPPPPNLVAAPVSYGGAPSWGTQQRLPAPSMPQHVAPRHVPDSRSFMQQGPVIRREPVVESGPPVIAGTEFMPTSMMVRRPQSKPTAPKRRRLVPMPQLAPPVGDGSATPQPPRQSAVSAESAYDTFMAELGK